MTEQQIKRIAVIGAGTMGGGIAVSLLQAGLQVELCDPSPDALGRAAKRAASRAGEEAGQRLRIHSSLREAVEEVDLVIEAVPEQLELKRDIFTRLDEHAPAHALLASNTSELSITVLAGATKRPEQVIGMHWFNPPERMRLIELVEGVHTAPVTVAAAREVAERCGKTVVTVKDRQGFVTTRLLAALLLEAIRLHEEGVAEQADLDLAVKLGLNHPMGPLELADYVGLDTVLFIAEGMHSAYGERFLPPQSLRRLVDAGMLGRKSGRGFYSYPADG